jgi:hypothetical protein
MRVVPLRVGRERYKALNYNMLRHISLLRSKTPVVAIRGSIVIVTTRSRSGNYQSMAVSKFIYYGHIKKAVKPKKIAGSGEARMMARLRVLNSIINSDSALGDSTMIEFTAGVLDS